MDRSWRRSFFSMSLAAASILACRGAGAQEPFAAWNLEPGVGQAHLVMVARVASVGKLTVVEGAKTDVTLREYRFQPIKRLKGLFQRDQLSMTSADLGCSTDDASDSCPLKEGEFRLLILAQQPGQTWGCVSAPSASATFDERVPLLSGADDPIVSVVESLIRVSDSRSRRERAALLVERLQTLDGVAAIPLLTSLRLRADWAAAIPETLPALTRLAGSKSTVERASAIATIRDVLATGVKPQDAKLLDGAANTLFTVFETEIEATTVRVDALEAMRHLLSLKPNVAGAREVLEKQARSAPTNAERTAALTALARITHPQAKAAVLDAIAALPLDEAPARETEYINAALRVDSAAGEKVVLRRLERSMQARQSIEAEVDALGRRRSKASLELLLAAAKQPSLSASDRRKVAWALGLLGDERAVPALATWMRSDNYQLKEAALAALENLDAPTGAREVRSLLRTEAHLPYKLRVARLLARHGLADGYSLAAEHLSDGAQTAAAALVLAALGDPRTTKDLSAIVSARPDRRWHAAALIGLAAAGDVVTKRQLTAILADDRHPLALGAAEAAGLSGDPELLAPLAKFVQSRNRQIAATALAAVRRYFADVRSSPRGLAAVDDGQASAVRLPAEMRSDLFRASAAMVLDPYVDIDLRREALTVARLTGDRGYSKLVSEVRDQADLEGTPLLADAEPAQRRERGLED